jgi:hypothetical protein
MGFLSRFKTSSTEVAPAAVAGMRVQAGARAASVAVAEPAFAPRATRSSNCLKDFLWHLNGIGRGTLLDLGPVWQSTVTFFGERGFKVFTEDILSGLNRFTREAETANLTLSMDEQRPSKSQLARKFLESTLQYGPRSFDAVLAWDLWDYMDDETRVQASDRLSYLLRDGGVIFAIFHSKRPEQFRRYRVVDESTMELIPGPSPAPFGRVFQNREMMELFGKCHSSKTYLGRDQVREALFVK